MSKFRNHNRDSLPLHNWDWRLGPWLNSKCGKRQTISEKRSTDMKVSIYVQRMRASGHGGRNLAQRCPFSQVLQGQCWQFMHLRQSRRELSRKEEILSRESARDWIPRNRGNCGDSREHWESCSCRRPPTKWRRLEQTSLLASTSRRSWEGTRRRRRQVRTVMMGLMPLTESQMIWCWWWQVRKRWFLRFWPWCGVGSGHNICISWINNDQYTYGIKTSFV